MNILANSPSLQNCREPLLNGIDNLVLSGTLSHTRNRTQIRYGFQADDFLNPHDNHILHHRKSRICFPILGLCCHSNAEDSCLNQNLQKERKYGNIKTIKKNPINNIKCVIVFSKSQSVFYMDIKINSYQSIFPCLEYHSTDHKCVKLFL